MESSRQTPWHLAALIVSLVLVALAPSSDSLWIDEGHTARFVQAASFGDMLGAVVGDVNSQAQMPGFVAAAWVAGRVLGTSEWALRAQNILWGALGVLFLWHAGRLLGTCVPPLLFAVSPFVWFYLDEARPYGMQLGGAAALAAAMVRLVCLRRLDSTTAVLWLFGGWVTCAASMLGAFPFGAATLVALSLVWRLRLPTDRRAMVVMAVCYAGLAVLGAYYAWSVLRGAGGARLWSVGLGNIGFSVYELLGFAGLGPGRIEIREAGREGLGVVFSLLAGSAAPLALLGLLLAACSLLALRLHREPWRALFFTCLATVVLGFVSLAGAAAVAQWPFWGRHLAPLLPFIIIATTAACLGTSLPGWVGRTVLVAIGICWLASSLSLRTMPRHAKDAYRQAAAFAKSQLDAGRTVWWAADEATGRYYNVPLSDTGIAGTARIVFAPDTKALAGLAVPDVIVLSRPDQFDERGGIRETLAAQGFRQTHRWIAFATWER